MLFIFGTTFYPVYAGASGHPFAFVAVFSAICVVWAFFRNSDLLKEAKKTAYGADGGNPNGSKFASFMIFIAMLTFFVAVHGLGFFVGSLF